MMDDYLEWKAMGEGGTPPTWAGYLSSLNAERLVAFPDTLSPAVYREPERYAAGWLEASDAQRAAARRSFLREPLPQRQGPQSRAKRYVFPQRERNALDPKSPKVKFAYQTEYEKLGANNPSTTEWQVSRLEKHGTALFLANSEPLTPIAAATQREICHIHTSDMSAHVTLSFADAEEVIRKGWGERHRLSGTDWIPLGYTFLYVPRSVQETEILGQIFQAGVDFMKAA